MVRQGASRGRGGRLDEAIRRASESDTPIDITATGNLVAAARAIDTRTLQAQWGRFCPDTSLGYLPIGKPLH